MLRCRGATDPRDKIYGLLGIASLGHRLLNNCKSTNAPLPKADYTLSVQDIYVHSCRTWMQHQGENAKITFLPYAYGNNTVSTQSSGTSPWPSWPPNWSRASSRHPRADYTISRPLQDVVPESPVPGSSTRHMLILKLVVDTSSVRAES